MHASSTLVLIGIAALFSAAFIPHTTKPSVASTLVEVNHPVACPPQWLPVLLASSSRHDDSPVPQLDDEDHPFEGDETLPMKRRMAAMGVVGGDLVAARVVARGGRGLHKRAAHKLPLATAALLRQGRGRGRGQATHSRRRPMQQG